MNKFTENRDTKAQSLWVIFMRVVGLLMFIAPMYLPLKAYFFTDIQNVSMTTNDIALACVGFLLSSGGKQIGILANNIGIAINNFLTKFTK